MSKTISLHLQIEADYICDMGRNMYNFEENEAFAINLITESFIGISHDHVMKVLNGDAMVTGWDICANSDCTQCKGKVQAHYVEKEDKKFKTKVLKHKLYLHKGYYKIGQFHISKEQIDEYCRVKILHYRNSDRELFEDDLELARNSFWSSNNHKRPSDTYIPKENSLDYLFTTTIVPFIDELDKYVETIKPLDTRMLYEIHEKLAIKYSIIKEELSIPHKPKPVRSEGCLLVTVCNEQDEEVSYNLEKAMYLQYIDARGSAIRKQKITMAQDIEKDKVIKRFQQLEKTVGYAHKEMMESMGLYHSQSGFYDANNNFIEYQVNGLLQWYMFKLAFDIKERDIDKLPNEIKLDKNEDAFIDGELIEEKIDLR